MPNGFILPGWPDFFSLARNKGYVSMWICFDLYAVDGLR